MNKLFKKVVTLVTVFAIAVSLVTVNSVGVAEAKGESRGTNFTGEELFKGLIFGQGEVAEKLPFIWNEEVLKETNKPEVQEVANAVSALIKEENPEYFSKLRKSIDSGNRVELNALLTEAGEHLDAYAEKVGLKNVDQEALDTAQGRSIIAAVGAIVYLGGAVTTVLVVTHGIAVTAGIAAYGWKYTPYISPDGEGSQFNQEATVNKVMNALTAI